MGCEEQCGNMLEDTCTCSESAGATANDRGPESLISAGEHGGNPKIRRRVQIDQRPCQTPDLESSATTNKQTRLGLF